MEKNGTIYFYRIAAMKLNGCAIKIRCKNIFGQTWLKYHGNYSE